jgi:hypothetical protein
MNVVAVSVYVVSSYTEWLTLSAGTEGAEAFAKKCNWLKTGTRLPNTLTHAVNLTCYVYSESSS